MFLKLFFSLKAAKVPFRHAVVASVREELTGLPTPFWVGEQQYEVGGNPERVEENAAEKQ